MSRYKLLNAIEKLEPDSATELTQEEVKKLEGRNIENEENDELDKQSYKDSFLTQKALLKTKNRKSINFAAHPKSPNTPDILAAFHPSGCGMPQALSTPFQRNTENTEEDYPESPKTIICLDV